MPARPAFAAPFSPPLARPLAPPTCRPRRVRRGAPALALSMAADHAAYKPDDVAVAWKDAIAAAIEDYMTPGTNVCIGDAPPHLLTPVIDLLDVNLQINKLIDVAFVATSPAVAAQLAERHLPTDLSANYGADLALYFAPALAADTACNVTLGASNPGADVAAIALARRAVFLAWEDALVCAEADGLQSIPVQLSAFMPGAAARALRECPTLGALGVVDVRARNDASGIADVRLRAGAFAPAVARALQRSPLCGAPGLHAASSKTTLLLASGGDAPPQERTPAAATLADASPEAGERRMRPADGETVTEAMRALAPYWAVSEGDATSSLLGRFVLRDEARADALAEHAREMAAIARVSPEVRLSGPVLRVCVSGWEAGGVTEVDLLFARNVSAAFGQLQRQE